MAALLETDRLRLRRFAPDDAAALHAMCSDAEVTRFLPFDTLESLDGARRLLEDKFLAHYREADAHRAEGMAEGAAKSTGGGETSELLDARWALCERATGEVIGFIQVSAGDAHDVGYALRRESWGRGFAREALDAVIAWARTQGISFLTATHDVDNPRSGAVMRACGMTARYAYREQWLPKKPIVTFCMHQIDLTPHAPEYRTYLDRWPEVPLVAPCCQRIG